MSDPKPSWLLEQQAETLEAVASWLRICGEDEAETALYEAARHLRKAASIHRDYQDAT